MTVYAHCRLKPLVLPAEAIAKHLIPARHSSVVAEREYYLEKKQKSKHRFSLNDRGEKKAIKVDLDKKKIDELKALETKATNPYTAMQLKKLYPEMFGNTGEIRKTVVEVCCGTGDFLLNAAKQCPTENFIAVDIAMSCVQRGVKKAYEGGLKNLWFYCGSGEDFFAHDFSKIPFSRIMVNFPDPWPKKRHFKRRVVNQRFVELAASALGVGGTFTTATDVPYLATEHRSLLATHKSFVEEFASIDDERQDRIDPSDGNHRNGLPLPYYCFASVYQRKNLYHSQKVFFTHHRKI